MTKLLNNISIIIRVSTPPRFPPYMITPTVANSIQTKVLIAAHARTCCKLNDRGFSGAQRFLILKSERRNTIVTLVTLRKTRVTKMKFNICTYIMKTWSTGALAPNCFFTTVASSDKSRRAADTISSSFIASPAAIYTRTRFKYCSTRLSATKPLAVWVVWTVSRVFGSPVMKLSRNPWGIIKI
jgi:hypothetical protein